MRRRRIGIEGVGPFLRGLAPQRDSADNGIQAPTVRPAGRGILADHRDQIVLRADFSEQMLKYGADRNCVCGSVAGFEVGLES